MLSCLVKGNQMYTWKITLTAKDSYGTSHTYIYLGVASTAKVAINKTLTLAKKEPWTNREIISVECLGELDFSTK